MAEEGSQIHIIETNCEPVTSADLELLAFGNYGHYTSMQVRRRATRGLDLHLARLDQNALELFGKVPRPGHVVDCLRHAVKTEDACSVRVTLFSRDLRSVVHGTSVEPDVMVSVSAPLEADVSPLRARCVRYEREMPQVKHLATYGLLREVRGAREAGFDDALFLDSHGRISEGSTWNLCLFDGQTWVWPEAAALKGVTMQLIQGAMSNAGIPASTAPVHATALGGFQAAVATNSVSPARPVTAIGAHALEAEPSSWSVVQDLYEAIPWQSL